MGADFYETPGELAGRPRRGRPPLGIGAARSIEGAIIDKNCRIGAAPGRLPCQRADKLRPRSRA